MEAKFEIKLLDVTWYDRDTVLLVKESFIPLKIEFDIGIHGFLCNTVIYPKADGIKHGQLAFRYLENSSDQPYIEAVDGEKIALKKIVDKETGKEWWIEGNYWIASDKCWDSKAYRTAGKMLVNLCDQFCQINIGSSEFTAQQLDRYLSDFKSDLWELILDESSYVTGSAKNTLDGGVSEDSIHIIENVLDHAQRILKNPKAELREIQTLKPRRKIKPVNRTFMEMATQSYPTHLTSRATTPSYNVPENQYVLFVLERIHKILKQLVAVSMSKQNRYESKIEKLVERDDAFCDSRLIDKNLVRKDLEKIKRSYNLDYLNESLSKKIESIKELNQVGLEKWYLKVGAITRQTDSYFGGVRKHINDEWFESEKGSRTVFLTFNEKSFQQCFEKDFEYEVEAELRLEESVPETGSSWHRYTIIRLFSAIIIGGKSLQLRRDKFQSEIKKAMALDAVGWKKILNHQELTEQNREKISVRTQIIFYQESYQKSKIAHQLLEPKLSKFKYVLMGMRALQIKTSATFPNSMTFVQNPSYQALHSGYKSLRNKTNLNDDDLLLSLEKVDEIGLINMPLLYERWCFLQIIKVLVQSYNYIPTHDWKRNLLKIISNKSRTESLDFSNVPVKRNISLKYEPTLKNNKRPDFVMDVVVQLKNNDQLTRRFIMDAKYYSSELFHNLGGISNIIKSLYIDKNYSEDRNNSVFILHPAVNTISEKVSPQSWGVNSFLGELEIFDWDSELRLNHYHQYGSVCVNPVLRLSYLDELQRLIGMFLQFGIENNKIQRESDDVMSFNFCLACGSHDLRSVDKGNNSNIKSSWYECNECKHFTVYNHCFNCNTRLIKNGDYWTYHSQMPMEPLNIKCPACECLL